MFQVFNDSGIPFNVRIKPENGMLGPIVEFYDARFPHTEFGQFVSSYYIETLLTDHFGPAIDSEECSGLTLDAGIPAWVIGKSACKQVGLFLRSRIEQ